MQGGQNDVVLLLDVRYMHAQKLVLIIPKLLCYAHKCKHLTAKKWLLATEIVLSKHVAFVVG